MAKCWHLILTLYTESAIRIGLPLQSLSYTQIHTALAIVLVLSIVTHWLENALKAWLVRSVYILYMFTSFITPLYETSIIDYTL